MEIQRSVEDLVSNLGQVVSDGKDYIERLQEKMDELRDASDNLQSHLEEAENALQALEDMSAGDLDDALNEAANLVD